VSASKFGQVERRI